MIPILTTSSMRAIDNYAIKGNITRGYSYMQKAGKGLYNAVITLNLNPKTDEIAILCGKGNNGGDGYVVGRLLIDDGYRVMCYGLCTGDSLTGEAKLVFDEYSAAKGNFFYITKSEELEELNRFSLLIDALLGTGTTGDPRGLYADVITMINASGKMILSIDTPSGLNSDSGIPGKPTVAADITMAMGFPKIGQFFYPGRKYVGSLQIKDLEYPLDIVEKNSIGIGVPEFEDLNQCVPERRPDGSKFDHGLALIVGGSKGMAGSVSLSALSALRTGCGMVHCAIPESLIPIISIKVTEPVLHPLYETTEGTSSLKNMDRILEIAHPMQAVLIGPGISYKANTSDLVKQLVEKLSIPVILDADGINAYKGWAERLKKHKGELIITPHIKEWERLFGILPQKPIERIGELKKKAQNFSMTIILKGNPTIITDKGGNTIVLPVGNSGMATAGSGDVLSGIILSLISQGLRAWDAAVLGVSIHGLAGEGASIQFGEHSLIASDIINAIPMVFKQILAQTHQGIVFSNKKHKPFIF